MRTVELATEIHKYLADLQIGQQKVSSHLEGSLLTFELFHPVNGKVKVSQPVPYKSHFLSHGIGLKLPSDFPENCELEVYDYGGIFDPVDGYVPGDHYATTFFALLSALLFIETKKEQYFIQAKKAIEFHLRTSIDEYYFAQWGFHWDFKNFAFLETFKLLNEYLSPDERQQWIQVLKSWKESTRSKASNWIAMRAYASLLRSLLAGRVFDKLNYLWRIRALYRNRTSEGCFDDNRGMSRPIQYHAYVLALLHRIYLLNGNEKIREYFLKGVDYLISFVDPDGDFNYLGRGQEQIFGYGVVIYVLDGAREMNPQGPYAHYREKVWNYLLQFKRDGYFPLVLNRCPDEEKCGWYDYHHLTVYNAFFAAWLMMGHRLKTGQTNKPEEVVRKSIFYKSTGTYIHSKGALFFVICGGLKEYVSEAGLTPQHIWIDPHGWIFSCPGGPSPNRFGKLNRVEHVEKNVFAPVAKSSDGIWFYPAGKRGVIRAERSDTVEIVLDYGPFTVKRSIQFLSEGIEFEDRFFFKANKTFEEFRIINLPVSVSNFTVQGLQADLIQFASSSGSWHLELLQSDFTTCSFQEMEKIKGARGWIRIYGMKITELNVQKREEHGVRFILKSNSY